MTAASLGMAGNSGVPLQRQLAEGADLDEFGFGQPGTAIDYLLSERWRLQGTTGAENAGDILLTLRFD